jgi:pyruvate carboxylase subunit B
METKNYVMGLYGTPPGEISEEMKGKVLGKKQPIDCRPADLLQPRLEQARKEIGTLAASEEDMLSYALFPEIAKAYFLWRESRKERQQATGITQ